MQEARHVLAHKSSVPFFAIFGWAIVFSLSCGLPHAVAQSSVPVGIVDPQVVLKQSVSGKKLIANLEEHGAAREKVLATDEEELKKLREKIQNSQDIDDDERASLQGQFQRKIQKFEERKQTFRQEMAQKQNEMLAEYMEKVRTATKAVAERRGFSMVIDKGSNLYAAQGLEITDDVVKEFDQLYP